MFGERGARHYSVEAGLFGPALQGRLDVREKPYERNAARGFIRLQPLGQREGLAPLGMQINDDKRGRLSKCRCQKVVRASQKSHLYPMIFGSRPDLAGEEHIINGGYDVLAHP